MKMFADFDDELRDDTISRFLEKTNPHQEAVNYRMKLAAKIFNGMKSKGWNNTRFAEEMGVKNLSIISKWLSGTNNFESDTLFQIQKVLGIELLNYNDEYNNYGMRITLVVEPKTHNSDFTSNLIDVNGGMQPTETIVMNQ